MGISAPDGDVPEKGSANRAEGVGGWGRFLPPVSPGPAPITFDSVAWPSWPRVSLRALPTQPQTSLSLKEADALETETKLFEDLEFQQLERESRVEEERELAGQGLLRSKAELLRSVAKRKVCTAHSRTVLVTDGG